MPQRIQRKRAQGWRAPVGARYVGRGTRYGNPWVIVETRNPAGWAVSWIGPREVSAPGGAYWVRCGYRNTAHDVSVQLYRQWIETRPEFAEQARRELAGRDLMCWCAPELACHADVLLALANPAPAQPGPAAVADQPTPKENQ